MRRVLRGFSLVLIVAGSLLILDAAVTLVWQEPLSALYARVNQNELGDELNQLEDETPTAAERAALRKLRGEKRRMAFLARRLNRRVHEGHPMGRIEIPKISASFVFVQGTDAGDLREGPGHYVQTPLPGAGGTTAVAGHRTTYLAPFHDLNELNHGDRVIMHMPYGVFTYRVEDTKIVEPGATWVMRRKSYDRIVLTACHPLYSAAQRIVAFARLERAEARGAALINGSARHSLFGKLRH